MAKVSDRERKRLTLDERIRAYLDVCPAAVSGQHGHDQTFKVAIALIRGFDLSPDRALPFMRRYNQRCQPRWSEKELKHKMADADKRSGRRGYLL